jgi:hypothetical protein
LSSERMPKRRSLRASVWCAATMLRDGESMRALSGVL